MQSYPTFLEFFPNRFFQPWQILFNVDGFRVALEDGDSIQGFYTVRQVVAFSRIEAERKATMGLRREERFSDLLHSHQENTSSTHELAVAIEEVKRISWRQYFFGSYAKSFVFY